LNGAAGEILIEKDASTNKISARHNRSEDGYLLEVPILLFVVLLTVAILIPHLSPLGRKVVLTIAAVPVLFALYYMIVIPGWRPGVTPLRWPWNWLSFLLCAILIVSAVVIINLN
jgi:hypothetical protein